MVAQLAFYKGKGNWQDRLIRWWTNSDYSHVELVVQGAWYSTSPRDLEVRKKVIQPKRGSWQYVDVNVDQQWVRDVYKRTKGASYDWMGIVGFVLPFIKDSKRRWYCSEWCNYAVTKQRDQLSPGDLYNKVNNK